MKTRVAKKIVKNKEVLKYNRNQIKKAENTVARYERNKKDSE